MCDAASITPSSPLPQDLAKEVSRAGAVPWDQLKRLHCQLKAARPDTPNLYKVQVQDGILWLWMPGVHARSKAGNCAPPPHPTTACAALRIPL